MPGELLGDAVLELRADLRPLAVGLKAAERETELSLGRIQATADRRLGALGKGANMSGVSRNMAAGERAYQAEAARSATAARGLRSEHDLLARSAGREHASLAGLTGIMGPLGGRYETLARQHRLLRSQGVDYLAAGMVGLGATFAYEGVKAAASFDKLAKSIQQQAGVGAREANRLVEVVKQVATQSPASYQQIADAVAAQYRLFGQNAQQISHNTELFIAFSEHAQRDVIPTITNLSQVMRLFHPAGMSVADVMDTLVNLAQKTQRPLGDYLDLLHRFGPQLHAAGFSLTQTVGLFDAFAKAGIDTTGMGRGLNTMLSNAEKQLKATANATADGGVKLHQYRAAVETAQARVDTLSKKLASGKGNQQALNEQLAAARDRLTAAQEKLHIYTATTDKAGKAHLTLSSIIADELKQIEGAHTKQDALNIAIKDFGARLGPQMAAALFGNKKGLDAMERSLGNAHGKTEDLAKAQRDTLGGQLKILEHDFTNIAGTVGKDLLPPLQAVVGVIGDIAKGIQQFSSGSTKGLAELIAAVGVGGGALTLLSRHSPLGNLLGKLPGPLGSLLGRVGGASAGGLSGMHGVGPGSAADPIAVWVMNSGGVGPGGGKGPAAAGAGAAAAEAATAGEAAAKLTLRETLGRAGALAMGVSAFAEASHAAPGWRNQLNAMAHGVDPTAVLHLVGLPALSDLLPDVKKPMNAARATPVERSGGWRMGPGGWRFQAPTYGARSGYGPTQAGAVGPLGSGSAPFVHQSAGVEQATRDFLAMNTALAKLETRKTGVAATAKSLDSLAKEAAKAGDVKWAMADRLGAEMLRTRSVGSRGVRQLVGELGKLAPGARAAATSSMVQMARMLEQQGRLPRGSTTKLINTMLSDFRGMRTKSVPVFQGLMKDATHQLTLLEQRAKTTTGKTRQETLAEITALKSGVGQTFDVMVRDSSRKIESMHAAIKGGSQKAADDARINFSQVATNIYAGMNSGLISTQKGTSLIAQALNAELKAFGAKPVPAAAVAGTALGLQLAGSVLAIGRAGGHASGGLVPIGRPGAAGTDTVPVSMLVGEGETVAVFNRHQWPEANARFADEGGLPGFFSRRRTPNAAPAPYARGGTPTRRFASGGISFSGPASTFGPPGEAAGSTAYGKSSADPGLSLRLPGTDALDPRNRALMGQTFHISLAGKSGDFMDIDLGPASWTGRNVDVTGAAAQAMGLWPFPTGAIAGIGGAAGGAAGVAGAAAAVWRAIKAPTVSGVGTIPDAVRAGLQIATDAANKYGQAHMPVASAGVTVVGAAGGPTGVGTYRGIPMANWVISALNYAAGRGASPQPTSGYRPGFDPHTASGTSEHSGTQYPHGAVDFGGYNDPAAYAAKMSVVNATSGFQWPLLAPIGFHDDGHASGTGHQLGGLIRAASGALTTAQTSQLHPKIHGRRRPTRAPHFRRIKALPTLPPAPEFHELDDLEAAIADAEFWSNRRGFVDQIAAPDGITFGDTTAPVVTTSDGRQVVNWYDPALGNNVWPFTGYIDATTHQRTKSINRRLSEIGPPGANPPDSIVAAVRSGAMSSYSASTYTDPGWQQLGMAKAVYDNYFKAVGLAVKASQRLGAVGGGGYLGNITRFRDQERDELNWLFRVLGWVPSDVSTALSKAGSGEIPGLYGAIPKGVSTRLKDLLHGHMPAWPDVVIKSLTHTRHPGKAFKQWLQQYVEKFKDEQATADRYQELIGSVGESEIAKYDTQISGWLAGHRVTSDVKTQGHPGTAGKPAVPGKGGRPGTPATPGTAATQTTYSYKWNLRDRLTNIETDRGKAHVRLAKMPFWWTGSTDGWRAQAKREKAWIDRVFDARKAAYSGLREDGRGYASGYSSQQQAETAETSRTGQELQNAKNTIGGLKGSGGDWRKGQRRWSSLAGPVSGGEDSDPPGSDTKWFIGFATELATQLGKADAHLQEADPSQSPTDPNSFAARIRSYLAGGSDLNNNLLLAGQAFAPLLRERSELAGTTLTGGGLSPENQATLNQLLRTQVEQLGTFGEISQAQYGVLSNLGNLPPFGGSFAEGGVIPGPTGAARMIVAHGGETVTPPGGDVPVVIIEKSGDLERLVDVRIERRTREMARRASRSLPSRGGGQF